MKLRPAARLGGLALCWAALGGATPAPLAAQPPLRAPLPAPVTPPARPADVAPLPPLPLSERPMHLERPVHPEPPLAALAHAKMKVDLERELKHDFKYD